MMGCSMIFGTVSAVTLAFAACERPSAEHEETSFGIELPRTDRGVRDTAANQ